MSIDPNVTSFAFNDGATIHNNVAIGKKPPAANTPYAAPADKRDDAPEKLSSVRKKYAPNADKPTTASASPGTLSLPSILKQIDPNAISAIMPSLMAAMDRSNNILKSADNQHVYDILSAALYFSLGDFLNKRNKFVETYLDTTDIENWLSNFSSVNYEIMNIAVNRLFEYKVSNPGELYQELYIPPVIYGEDIPYNLVAVAPDLFVKQYYTEDEDPYPGYIQWLYEDQVVYTKRQLSDYPFESLDDYAIFSAKSAFDSYVNLETIIRGFLDDIFFDLTIDLVKKEIKDIYVDGTLGNGSSFDMLAFVEQLLGALGVDINQCINKAIQGVTNPENIKNAVEKFSKNMANMKKMKKEHSGVYKKTDQIPAAPAVLSSKRKEVNWKGSA